MVKYKQNKRRGVRTTKCMHTYIDVDLLDYVNEQPNKTRFINDAIRAYKINEEQWR